MDWIGLERVAAELVLEKDALHIYAAFAIQVAAAVIIRKPISHWAPWVIVMGFAVLNESLDDARGGSENSTLADARRGA